MKLEPWRQENGQIDYSHPGVPDEYLCIQQVTPDELGLTTFGRVEYAAVPQECWSGFRPPERLLLALHYAYRTWQPDEPGGWFRLSKRLYTRAGLPDRSNRRRALDQLARDGLIEVRRDRTKTSLVRLMQTGPHKLTHTKVNSRP